MDGILSLVGMALLLGLLVFPIWAIVRIRSLGEENNTLQRQLELLEHDMRELRRGLKTLIDRPAGSATKVQIGWRLV